MESKKGSARLYVVCGYVASGKTTVSERLSYVTGAYVIRTDDMRKEMFPLEFDYKKDVHPSPSEIDKWIASNDTSKIDFQQVVGPVMGMQEEGYKQVVDKYAPMVNAQKRTVYDAAFARMEACLLEGSDVVMDATFSRKELRKRAHDSAARSGMKEVYTIQVVCGEDAVSRRLEARRNGQDNVTSNAKQLEVYRIVKNEFDMSRIEDDNPVGMTIKRIVYHTDTHEVESYGEDDEIMRLIKADVLDFLSGKYAKEVSAWAR